ncbi:MAG: glycosyltransferase family 39 protein [Planctomycetota bacterium]
MTPGPAPSAERLSARGTTALALLFAAGSLIALAWQGYVHVPFPYALEWQEPAMLEHALRVRSGEGLYVAPSVEFAPFPYPPLFHWLGAASTVAFGPDLVALRAVSLASTLALLALVAAMGARRGGAAGGAITAGVRAASAPWTGEWFFVARVDALAVSLSAAALFVATGARAAGGSFLAGLVAGVLAALAILAKQTSFGLAAALLVGLGLARATRRTAAGFSVGVAAALVPLAVALEGRSSGWFSFTTVDLLSGSPWYVPAAIDYWRELALVAAPVVGLVVAGRGAPASESSPVRTVEWFAVAALVAMGWAGRAHEGGFRNTLLPAALALALVAGPAFARAARTRPRAALPLVVLLFGVLHLGWSRAPMPGLDEAEHVGQLAARIASIDGEVWQPHGAIDPRTPGGVHAMAINDLLKSGERDVAQRFVDDLTNALNAKRFAAIVFGVEISEWADLEPLGRNYVVRERLDGFDHEMPIGAPHAPRLLLVPR